LSSPGDLDIQREGVFLTTSERTLAIFASISPPSPLTPALSAISPNVAHIKQFYVLACDLGLLRDIGLVMGVAFRFLLP
jgi:hypothetical protein